MRDGESGSAKRKRPRTCIGCGEEFPKGSLIRVVRRPSGDVEEDRTGRAPGRGVYLCRRTACVLRARKRNLLARSLKVPVPEGLYETLLSGLEASGIMEIPIGGDLPEEY